MTSPMRDDEAASLHSVLMAVFRCVTGPRRATYVSTPITTGPRFVAWRASTPGLGPGTPEYRRALERDVIAPNTASAQTLVARVRREFGDVVIDPTALEDVSGWEQFHYHRFWTDVITEFAGRVVFAEGWSYSVGCVLEFESASRANLVLLDHTLRPLNIEQSLGAIDKAISELGAVGVATEPLMTARDGLRSSEPASSQ